MIVNTISWPWKWSIDIIYDPAQVLLRFSHMIRSIMDDYCQRMYYFQERTGKRHFFIPVWKETQRWGGEGGCQLTS